MWMWAAAYLVISFAVAIGAGKMIHYGGGGNEMLNQGAEVND